VTPPSGARQASLPTSATHPLPVSAHVFHIAWYILLSVLELVGIVFAIRAVLRTRTAQGAIAWTLGLVTLPVVAVPLYLVFGRGRFQGYVEAIRSQSVERISTIQENLDRIRSFCRVLPGRWETDLQVLNRLGRTPCTASNHIELLIDGQACFDAIFAAVTAAQRYILVQFYILRDDAIGRDFMGRLMERARAGVQVYVLYDEIGSFSLPRKSIEAMRAAGVHVSAFQTTRGRRNRFQLNFRNHRKVVVVDGRVGFTGGLNVGDEYMGRSPKFGHWRDTQVRLEGPSVQAVQAVWMSDWYWATRTAPQLDWDPVPSERSDVPVFVLGTGPADIDSRLQLFFMQCLSVARRRAWFANPYFVPDGPTFETMRLAALRGVDVRLLLPEKNDSKMIELASFSFLAAAERAGIKTLLYQEGFLHQKVMLIDDALSSVGSANLDNRSMRLNFELTTLVVDKDFALEVERMLEKDFSRARRVTAAEVDGRGWPYRFSVRAARLLSPIL
jgi:cardiolipin synthase A/B